MLETNWQTVEIKQVTSLLKDGSHGTHSDVIDGIPLLSAKDINNGTICTDNGPRRISLEEFEAIHKNYSIQDGDILLTIVGTIGRVAQVTNCKNNFTLQRSVAILRFKDRALNDFMYYVMQGKRFYMELRKRESKGAQGGVYLGEIGKISVNLPSAGEQERIVGLLKSWDEYLKALDKKIDLKMAIRNGLAQQLLSGRIRPSGFNDEWNLATLGQIGKVSMCKRILKNQTSESGDIPFYKIGTFGKQPDAYIPRSLYEDYKAKYSFPNTGDILLSASGTIGRTVVYDGRPAYFQDSNIIWIANDEKIVLNSFLYHAYKKVTWHTAHGTIARLYNDNVRRITIKVPSLEEQEVIAELLDDADGEIELLIEQREFIAAQRSYLINNLTTGNLRLRLAGVDSKEKTYA